MQNLKLLTSCIAILLLSTSSVLVAQTYKQQLRSTEIISRMFDGKLKFNPQKTKKITATQLQKEIQSNDFIPVHLRDDVYNNLAPSVSEIKNWRAIVAEATADCGEIEVIIAIVYDAETATSEISMEVYLPPNNKCGKLIRALYPVLFKDDFSGKDIKLTTIKRCWPLSAEVSVCGDVLVLTSTEDTNSIESSCQSNSDCSKGGDYVIPYYELVMEEK